MALRIARPFARLPAEVADRNRQRLLGEMVLVAAAIVLLLPAFAPLGANDRGRNDRFVDAGGAVRGLPAPVLPTLCATVGAAAESSVRDRLCADRAVGNAASIDRIPPVLADARARAVAAFLAPLDEAQAKVAALRPKEADSEDVLASADPREVAEAEIRPFLDRYAIVPGDTDGPRPLACAYAQVEATLASTSTGPTANVLRANAVLLLAGTLDAHPATPATAMMAALPPSGRVDARCDGASLADAIASATALMTDARAAPAGAAKNAAMRALLHDAGAQWAAWSALGLVLLDLARRRVRPLAGAAIALVAWAVAAWVADVHWPLAPDFEAARPERLAWLPLLPFPPRWIGAMVGCAFVTGVAAMARPARDVAAQEAGSLLAYPGFVLATGIGWLVLLDLSANAHFGNRYLALYHQGHLWFAMTTLSIVAFLRQPIGRGLAWTLSLVDGAAGRASRAFGALGPGIALTALALAITAATALALQNRRQLTSELGRLWLIVGGAWFFFLRGTPFTERLARTGASLVSLARYVAPLLFVVAVLATAMFVTRDMGPLLIAAYGAGALVAASVAMWLHQRTGAMRSASALAVVLFAAWIAATTAALFRFGSLDPVAAARLENAAAPLASANDQLALVTWFRRAAPADGFGAGSVPWCGYRAVETCAGVPAQVQSDYTFTALAATFGFGGAWAITLGVLAWLYGLVRAHARATRGEPRMTRVGGRMINDEQAFLSWLVVAWVALALCQLAVTVAGNLAVIPLTGVTFPFVSFGMTSLVVNAAMLALAANLNVDTSLPRG